jgi:hypothetical protein
MNEIYVDIYDKRLRRYNGSSGRVAQSDRAPAF